MNHKSNKSLVTELEKDIDQLVAEGNPQNINSELTVNEILNTIVAYAKPVDFHLLVFPELIDLQKRLSQLDQNEKSDQEEWKDLSRKIAKKKVTRNHYLIYAIETLQQIAESHKYTFSKREGNVYLFNGRFWEKIESEKFKFFIGEFGVKIGIPESMSKHHAFRDDLVKQFHTSFYLEKDDGLEDKVLINLKNGCYEVDVKGGKLREFRKTDFLTYQLPFEYNPEAQAPLFQKYLDRVLPSKDLQTVFFESIAYTLTKNKNCKFEKMIIFKGEGANGKSVALDLIQELLGKKNVSNYSLSSLTNQSGYQRANIGDKLVNIASELSGSLESDYFKQLASGEPVEARKPYMPASEIHDYARFIFACNVLPQVEHTTGFFRRFLIIPFDVTIPKEERDVDLVNKIINVGELAGIFNLILKGLNRILVQRGFSNCPEIDDAGERYKKESNSVLMFLEDEGYKASRSYVPAQNIYERYKDYCRASGNKPFNYKNFRDNANRAKFDVNKKNIGWVIYVEPKLSEEDAQF